MYASYNGITLPPQGVAVNGLYVFKSVPTFTSSSLNTTALNSSKVNLYTFSISADPKGDISVKQLMFLVTINDPNQTYPHLNNFTFFKGSADYSSLVTIGEILNNYNTSLVNSAIGIGEHTLVLTFNTEETIPAGTTQTYTLKADVANFISSTALGADSISTSIPPDYDISINNRYLRMVFTKIYGLSYAPTDISTTNYNLLWSDRAALAVYAHSDSNGSSTPDWYNGFLVQNFPLPSQAKSAK